MDKELSIHLRYGTKTCLLTTRRTDFLSKAAAKFQLEEEEIEIYERKKKSITKIDVKDLRDFIQVEISKMQPVSTNRINGERLPKSMKVSNEVNEASSGSIVAEICIKLKENKPLAVTERELLFSHLQSLPLYLKRRLESGNPQPAEMKNRKIQATPIDQKLAYTQTDKLIDLPRTSTSTLDSNVHEEIKRYAKKEKRDPIKTADLMDKSFTERRNFILIKKPMVQFVKEKYPLLFNLSEVRNEVERIFYDGKCEEFITNVGKYADIVLSMAKDDDPLLLDICAKERSYETVVQKKYAREVGSILMLTSLINEERSYLKLQNTSVDKGNHPYIECHARLSEIFFDQYTFNVFTENMVICEATNFKEAILCLIANYFIFNISYPDDSFNTLVVMEKLYLEANDTEDCNIDEFVLQLIKTLKLKALARQR